MSVRPHDYMDMAIRLYDRMIIRSYSHTIAWSCGHVIVYHVTYHATRPSHDGSANQWVGGVLEYLI